MAVRKINIDESEISVIFGLHDDDYICLTDMVKAGDNSERTNIAIQNWMRRKDTISYLGVWENLHNPNFKCIEFDAIRPNSHPTDDCAGERRTTQYIKAVNHMQLICNQRIPPPYEWARGK